MDSAPKPNRELTVVPPKKLPTSYELKRHAAEMYVLSRVGKCTDGFAEVERQYAWLGQSSSNYGRKEAKPYYLGAFVPRGERN